MSDSIRSSNEGLAQEPAQEGAGTAPEPVVRWVGEQHRFEGYCGRAAQAQAQAQAQARPPEVMTRAQPVLPARPALPTVPPAPRKARHAVVRIGPRARQPPDAGAAGGGEAPPGEARPRAA